MYTGNEFYSLVLTILMVLVACTLLFGVMDAPPIGTLDPAKARAIDDDNRAAWARAMQAGTFRTEAMF